MRGFSGGPDKTNSKDYSNNELFENLLLSGLYSALSEEAF